VEKKALAEQRKIPVQKKKENDDHLDLDFKVKQI
jgi:hypothetical protein